MLIVTLLTISIHSLGQNTDNTTSKKDTVLTLPREVAKQVVKDLIRMDSLHGELFVSRSLLDLEKQNSRIKDSLLANTNQQIGIYQLKENQWKSLVAQKDIQIINLQNTSKRLAKDLRKVKRKKTFFQIGTGLFISGVAYLLIVR